MSTEVKKHFCTWYNKFTSKSINYEKWFDKVQDSKDPIRSALGGIRKSVKINISNNYGQTYIERHIKPMVDNLLWSIPSYLKTYNLNTEDLYKPILPNGMRTTKHIMGYLDRNGKSLSETAKINTKYYCSILGEKYCTGEEGQIVYVNISTSARAFVKLGHYGVDDGSCFSENGCNRIHKYNLGACDNTFVITISPVEKQETEKDDKNWARCWGFVNDKLDTVSISNTYRQYRDIKTGKIIPKLKSFQVENAVEDAFKEILGIKEPKATTNIVDVDTDIIYINGDDITYSDKTIDSHYLDSDNATW